MGQPLITLSFITAATLMASCTIGASPDGPDPSLVRIDEEPPGESCEAGGLAIHVGVDENGDDHLGNREIASTSYVCHGQAGTDGENGASSISEAAPLEPGEECGEGGQEIRWGQDLDADGELDESEVQGREHVCNGLPGSGLNSIVSVSEVEPGEACLAGGQAIRAGQDDNGDGLLQPSEVDSTLHVCNGGAGQTSLVRQEEELPGDSCEHGGQAIHAGLDIDEDGYLDDGEVVSTSYVCHSAPIEPGSPSLVDVVEVEPGSVCAFGGVEVLTGIDDDRDGTLAEDEVDARQPVCNGLAGPAGSPGQDALVAVATLAPGSDCVEGGLRIESGIDENRDGTLDPAEVTRAEVVCHGAPGADGEDGGDGVDGAPGRTSLVEVTAEAAGLNCPEGGQRIDTGFDLDNDRLLEPSETEATRYVCNGADGADGADGVDRASSLVDVVSLDPGSPCIYGGQRIFWGPDTDGDGSLSEAERGGQRDVCNGEPGADGADGSAALAEVEDVSPGVHCARGGIHLVAGVDENGNGSVDEVEETANTYVCHGADGSDGGSLATRVFNAAWGGVCARGGVRLEVGVDDDGNGELSDGEVDRTSYVCNVFVVELTAGSEHTCALMSNGTVRCWGLNEWGQVGDGTTTNRYGPVTVVDLEDAVQVSAGFTFTCAVLSDGTGRCWGNNTDGQLGNGTTDPSPTPVAVSGVASLVQVAGGHSHTCARRLDGTALCWGQNVLGQLGDGTWTSRTVPTPVVDLDELTHISAGDEHSCAVRMADTVYCWGTNRYGQLGDGTTTPRNEPVLVSGLAGVEAVSAFSYHHTCARESDGTVSCWGRNDQGQLGITGSSGSLVPVSVTGLTNVAALAIGDQHSCAVTHDGSAICWGRNQTGQLGNGTTASSDLPVPVNDVTFATAIGTGALHSCVIQGSGLLLCWGNNFYGQLGDGTTMDRHEPVAVALDLAP